MHAGQDINLKKGSVLKYWLPGSLELSNQLALSILKVSTFAISPMNFTMDTTATALRILSELKEGIASQKAMIALNSANNVDRMSTLMVETVYANKGLQNTMGSV